jgi:DNA-binding phage protein
LKLDDQINDAEKKNPGKMKALQEELTIIRKMSDIINDKGMSVREVAKKMQISEKRLQRILNFEVSPTIGTMLKFQKATESFFVIKISWA